MKQSFLFILIFPFLVLSFPCSYAADVTTFVSPDNSFAVLSDYLSRANSSLYISSYSFTSPYIMDQLINAKNKGVNIILMVEGGPVGGISNNSKNIFCNLEKHNISVFLYKGKLRFLHSKYIIEDNSSILISTENFGYGGFPKNNNFGNRGWGAIIEDEEIANEFLSLFFNDLRDSEKFSCEQFKEVYYLEFFGNYKPKFLSETYENQSVKIVIGPENSLESVLNLIDSAKKSIYVEQFYIYKYWGSVKHGSVEESPNLFLNALIKKAREGLDIKILMDSSPYNIEKDDPVSNYNTMNYINNLSKKENLSIEAKLVNLEKNGYKKIHTKGLIIDNETVLISSINWNENSVKNNREIGIIITGNAAKYYVNVFMDDWYGRREPEKNNLISIFGFLGFGVFIITVLIYFKKI